QRAVVELRDRKRPADARVVHDDVDAAELVERAVDDCRGAGDRRHVRLLGDRAPAGRRDRGRRGPGALAVGGDDGGAGGGERDGVRAAEPAAGAGDDGDLPVEEGHGGESITGGGGTATAAGLAVSSGVGSRPVLRGDDFARGGTWRSRSS